MTSLLVLLLSVPCVYWGQGIESRAPLEAVGIKRFCTEADLVSREPLPTPGITARAGLASPTRSPWIVANGWRFTRHPGTKYAYDVPAGKAALAAAEAFAYGGDAILVQAPSARFRINIAVGSSEYPREEAADPSAFALKIRRQLTDEQRALRVFGSEVVICRLTGDAKRIRLHLINYGGREIEGLRIRLRGAFRDGEARVAGVGRFPLQDHIVAGEATEFSIPRIVTYAVIDLAR